MAKRYRDFSDFLSRYFDCKMQKISVNLSMSCPNRDGTVGTGGCTYCNNLSFSPDYCNHGDTVASQLAAGRDFFARKYPAMKFLAYFQAYTSTHGDIDRLISCYEEALAFPDVKGIVIGTRPDCVPDDLLDYLAGVNSSRFVLIEYGAESSHNSTLHNINRCHTWEQTAEAICRTSAKGIPTGAHFIMGLPGETTEMMLSTVDRLSQLPLDTVKFHQLQLIKGTRMARDIADGKYDIPRFDVDSYIDLCCDIVARINPAITIERFTSQSPDNLLIYPKWGLKNHEFTNLLNNRLKALDITQGSLFRTDN